MNVYAAFVFIVIAGGSVAAQGGSNDNKEVCLQSANAYRAKHKATPPLEWDSTLAKNAQRYAETLMRLTLANSGKLSDEIWVHDPKNAENGWGENLYWGDGKKETTTTEEYCGFADKGWYDEIYNYNFKTGDKINGGVIGHFTQMVWKSSTRVGYGVAVASSPKWGTYGSKMVFVVAKYTPGGNNPPYTANVMPLIANDGCTEKEKQVCNNGVCVCAPGYATRSDGSCGKVYETNDGENNGQCESVSKCDCKEIAQRLNLPIKPIENPDYNRFPPGCYHKKTTSTFYFNEKSSLSECDYRRNCICKPQGSS